MKTIKLIMGILSIIFSILITFQSMLVGLGNTLSDNGEVGGSGWVLLAIAMLTGGIVMLATRKNSGKGGSVACLILYLIGGFIGMVVAGSYSDLKVWSGFALIVAGLNLIAILKRSRTE